MNSNVMYCVGHGPTYFVSTIHIAGLVEKILVLSINIAATATNDIDLAIGIAPSRA